MAVTQREIAERSGLSQATVSRILRGMECPSLDDQLRRNVLRLAEEVDYHPDASARGLVSRRTETIGVTLYSVEYLAQAYFATVIGGIARVSGEENYRIQFSTADGSVANRLSFKRHVRERSVDGLIIADQTIAEEDIRWLKEQNIPFVLIDRTLGLAEMNVVKGDYELGAFMATNHLVTLGHRRIAFFAEPLEWEKTAETLSGYRRALAEGELRQDDALILVGKGEFQQDRSAMRELVWQFRHMPEPVTAFACSSDEKAARILRAVLDAGLAVPGDMAVVGFNDDPQFAHLHLELTTIRIGLEEMGESSARLLLEAIEEGATGKRITLAPELVIRDSCGARRSTANAKRLRQEEVVR